MGKSIQLGEGRLVWLNVHQPKAFGDEKPKYSATILLPKNQGLEKGLNDAILEVLHENLPTSKLDMARKPIKDGDMEEGTLYHGHWVVKASSKSKPYILDRELKEMLEEDTQDAITSREYIYRGCWGRMVVNPYFYDVKGSFGVALGLETVIKTKDGDRINGGKPSLAEVQRRVLEDGYKIPVAPVQNMAPLPGTSQGQQELAPDYGVTPQGAGQQWEQQPPAPQPGSGTANAPTAPVFRSIRNGGGSESR